MNFVSTCEINKKMTTHRDLKSNKKQNRANRPSSKASRRFLMEWWKQNQLKIPTHWVPWSSGPLGLGRRVVSLLHEPTGVPSYYSFPRTHWVLFFCWGFSTVRASQSCKVFPFQIVCLWRPISPNRTALTSDLRSDACTVTAPNS